MIYQKGTVCLLAMFLTAMCWEWVNEFYFIGITCGILS